MRAARCPTIRPTPGPEHAYRDAPQAERATLRAEVVAAYRGNVAALVRRTVLEPSDWPEAEKAGATGVLLALEKFDPTRGAGLWVTARQWARNEIAKFVEADRYVADGDPYGCEAATTKRAALPSTLPPPNPGFPLP